MERIGGEIDRELARSGSRDAIPLAAITAAWPAAVGAAVARQAWPLRLGRDGTLHVAVASSTWAHELDLLQDAILDGLRARLADATPPAVRFAVGPIPEPPTPIEDAATENDPPIAVPPEIESAAARGGLGDRRSGAPRARREGGSSEPGQGPVRPRLLIHLVGPAIWRFAGLF